MAATINLDLDKEDFLTLVKGSTPDYKLFNHFIIRPAGYYVGGFKDDWVWNDNYLKSLPIECLKDIYLTIKNYKNDNSN